MSLPVFLLDPSEAAGAGIGSRVVLSGPEGRHAVTVRRLVVGADVELVDGAGLRLVGVVREAARPDRLTVEVTSLVLEPAPQPRLLVVQALAKGERADLAVEGLTEVGVDVIIPWAANRSVVRWEGERLENGLSRWRRTAAEATKQARRARCPEVTDLADTAAVARLLGASARSLVLHEAGALRLASMSLPATGNVVLVIGPEGGISPEELTVLQEAGGLICRLGPSVLRTSTAGTAAAALVLAASGRWD